MSKWLKYGFLLIAALAVVLSLSVISGWLVQTTLTQRERVAPIPGNLVMVDGAKTHVQCVGPLNAPVVFFESGVIGWSGVWAWLTKAASVDGFRACTWDRPGLGYSAATSRPADAATLARQWRQMLSAAQIKTPVILVGHSMGGVYGLVYASTYPKLVTTLVLLDTAHPQQMSRLPSSAINKTLSQVDLLDRSMPAVSSGLARGALVGDTYAPFQRLPPEDRDRFISIVSSEKHLLRSVQEYKAWPQTAKQAMTPIRSDLPLLVISAGNRDPTDPVGNEAWWTLHQGMAAASTNGVWTAVPDASHQSIIMDKQYAMLTWSLISSYLQSCGQPCIPKPR